MRREWRLYLDQLLEMTLCEWKLREQSSLLGFLWTLLQPLLMFVVLYELFTKWMGRFTDDFASYLVIGIVQYGFFQSGTSYGLTALSRRGSLITNFGIARELPVLAAVLSVALSYLLELALMLAFVLCMGARPAATWAYLPLLTAIHLAFVTGLSLSLSVAAARYPDVERIWTILLTAGFFLTPIFYTLDTVSPRRRDVLWLNPMTHLIELTRGCLLRGTAPSWAHLGALAVGVLGVCLAGYAFFKRSEPYLADYVTT